jgi:hypothetical protein
MGEHRNARVGEGLSSDELSRSVEMGFNHQKKKKINFF